MLTAQDAVSVRDSNWEGEGRGGSVFVMYIFLYFLVSFLYSRRRHSRRQYQIYVSLSLSSLSFFLSVLPVTVVQCHDMEWMFLLLKIYRKVFPVPFFTFKYKFVKPTFLRRNFQIGLTIVSIENFSNRFDYCFYRKFFK